MAQIYSIAISFSGDIIGVFYDISTEQFSVTLNGNNYPSGPDLGPAVEPVNFQINYIVYNGDFLTQGSFAPAYQYCRGSDLVRFQFKTSWPYAEPIVETDSVSCSTVGDVCDLRFTAVIPSKATDRVTADGSIYVQATSSFTPVKYSLSNVPYNQMENSTGLISGLLPGVYTVYARDTNNCLVQQTLKVSAQINFGHRFTAETQNLLGWTSIIKIYQDDYYGLPEEVKSSAQPVNARMRGENSEVFKSILGTELTIGLISTSNLQFLELFSDGERQAYAEWYVNTGSGEELKWKGWVVPGVYTEPYVTDTNYQINLEANDGLVSLKEADFVDANNKVIDADISLINIIALCLQQTDLDLPIRSACKTFEDNFNQTAADDPLAQTFINPFYVYNKDDGTPWNCYEVLEDILKTYCLRLVQWNAAWYLIPVYASTATLAYREYNTNGEYVSNSTFNPVINIRGASLSNRAVWRDRSQVLEISPAVGRINIVQKLKRKKFGFINGGFEYITVPETVPGNLLGYPSWALVLNGNTASWGYLDANEGQLVGNNSKYSGIFDSNSDNTAYAEDAYIITAFENIDFYPGIDSFRFSFEYYPEIERIFVAGVPAHTKFKWSLSLAGNYLQANGTWTTDANYQWVESVVESGSTNKWNKIEIKGVLPGVVGPSTSAQYQFKVMHGLTDTHPTNPNTWRRNSISEVKSIQTIYLAVGTTCYMVRQEGSPVDTVTRYYKLEVTTLSDDGVNRIRPNDYNASTNRVAWILFDSYNAQGFSNASVRVKVARFDNVSFIHLPSGAEPPNEKTYSGIANQKSRTTLTETVNIGDYIPDQINSKNAYSSLLQRADGVKTIDWARPSLNEINRLVALTLKQYTEQFSKPRFKLSGNLYTDVFFGFINSFNANNKNYLPMGMAIDFKSISTQVELIEIPTTTTTSGAPFTSGFVTAAFGKQFN